MRRGFLRRGRIVEVLDQFRRDAAARKTGIEPRQIGQAHAGAAKADGEAGVGVFRQNQTDPGVAQAGDENAPRRFR